MLFCWHNILSQYISLPSEAPQCFATFAVNAVISSGHRKKKEKICYWVCWCSFPSTPGFPCQGISWYPSWITAFSVLCLMFPQLSWKPLIKACKHKASSAEATKTSLLRKPSPLLDAARNKYFYKGLLRWCQVLAEVDIDGFLQLGEGAKEL